MIAMNTGTDAAPTTTTITVTGMTCSHCVAAVTEEVSKLEAVVAVTVDLDSGTVTVESDGPIDPAELVAAIGEAGYEVAG
jgi:copper ion binding protein